MPNMNALIGAGAAAICGNVFASPEDIQTVYRCFEQLAASLGIRGTVFFDFTAIAGSTPCVCFLIY